MLTQIQLSKDEYKDLVSYCELNNLIIDDVVQKSFLEGFRIEKYGLLNSKDRIIEKEIIKEVPVEKIVEIIKEVPVIEYIEIIKEVPVEKIVEIIKEIPSEPEKIEVIKYVDREVIKEVIVEKLINNDLEMPAKEIIIEKEIPVEIIKEVIVEKIIEKEVPVEVIKEIIIENNNDDLKLKLEAIQQTLMKLKQDNIEKDTLINKLKEQLSSQKNNEIKPAFFMRGSNLNNKL
jgi:hypothetical protein